ASYLFDLSSSRTKIPSVVLLLALGWGLHRGTEWLAADLPNLEPALPILGTIGLILIVLEGSLELDFDRSKLKMVRKASLLAFVPMLLLSFGLAFVVTAVTGATFLDALTNAIPLAVISSAIAIPTAHAFKGPEREFVIYESSLSDIAGVLVFNFVALNEVFEWRTFGEFGLELLIILVISFIATVGLAFLLSRIQHHVKFAPIILITILIYGVAKIYHLPGLVLILAFGMFLGNLDRLTRFAWIRKLRPDVLELEVKKLKELVTEAAFLVRSLFFLVFGYYIRTEDVLDLDSLVWAVGICVAIYGLRALWLMGSRLKLMPLVFIAPRGLITVLLFLSIPETRMLPVFGQSLIIQVVLISSVMMMFGTLLLGKGTAEPALAGAVVEDVADADLPAHEAEIPQPESPQG
ncbi:MAG TPA: sodium:proton antiporter, partial [Bacteroidia bacterium]|nr:sodium:proton antiporter [Bacteroidia bacterium]